MRKIFFVLWLGSILPFFSHAQDANKIMDAITLRMSKVKDYSVRANIKSDIPMIKILPVNAILYYKQKDQFKMVSKGIAILPKQGFTDLTKIIRQKGTYTAFVTGNEMQNKTPITIISILPLSDTSDVVLLKIWVDPNLNIVKSQMTTRSSGTLTATYEYGLQAAYGLPDRMVFTMDVKKFKIPKGLTTDIQRQSNPNQVVPKTGTIYILLSNYSINKGIDDAVFR